MPTPLQLLHAQIEQDRKGAIVNPAQIQLFRDYTAGKQPLALTEEQKEILKGLFKRTFCDNICRRIVSTVAGRVKLERYDVTNPELEKFLKVLWVLNWLPQLSSRVHFAAIRDGNSFVSLNWDNARKRVVLRRELVWNGKRGVFIAYDEFGEATYAVKEWTARIIDADGRVQPFQRRVVWYPDKIGRFIETTNGWEFYALPEVRDSSGAVIREAETKDWQPWLDGDGQPLGIPCVHFARMEAPVDSMTEANGVLDNYGAGILEGGVMGIQDAIGDDHWTILAANRFTGYQQAYATGVALEDDEGNPIELKLMPGTLIHVESEKAKFGTLSAGSIESLTKTLEVHHTAAARTTGTQIHVITGDWPSGVALLEADKPLVTQAENLAGSFGPAWASVANKAVRLANHFGDAQLDPTTPIVSVFDSPETSDRVALAEYAVLVAPLVSKREVWRILKYDKDKQDQLMRELQEEATLLMPQLPTGASTQINNLDRARSTQQDGEGGGASGNQAGKQ